MRLWPFWAPLTLAHVTFLQRDLLYLTPQARGLLIALAYEPGLQRIQEMMGYLESQLVPYTIPNLHISSHVEMLQAFVDVFQLRNKNLYLSLLYSFDERADQLDFVFSLREDFWMQIPDAEWLMLWINHVGMPTWDSLKNAVLTLADEIYERGLALEVITGLENHVVVKSRPVIDRVAEIVEPFMERLLPEARYLLLGLIYNDEESPMQISEEGFEEVRTILFHSQSAHKDGLLRVFAGNMSRFLSAHHPNLLMETDILDVLEGASEMLDFSDLQPVNDAGHMTFSTLTTLFERGHPLVLLRKLIELNQDLILRELGPEQVCRPFWQKEESCPMSCDDEPVDCLQFWLRFNSRDPTELSHMRALLDEMPFSELALEAQLSIFLRSKLPTVSFWRVASKIPLLLYRSWVSKLSLAQWCAILSLVRDTFTEDASSFANALPSETEHRDVLLARLQ